MLLVLCSTCAGPRHAYSFYQPNVQGDARGAGPAGTTRRASSGRGTSNSSRNLIAGTGGDVRDSITKASAAAAALTARRRCGHAHPAITPNAPLSCCAVAQTSLACSPTRARAELRVYQRVAAAHVRAARRGELGQARRRVDSRLRGVRRNFSPRRNARAFGAVPDVSFKAELTRP